MRSARLTKPANPRLARLRGARAVAAVHTSHTKKRWRGPVRSARAVVRHPGEPLMVPQPRGVADRRRSDGGNGIEAAADPRIPRRDPAQIPRGGSRAALRRPRNARRFTSPKQVTPHPRSRRRRPVWRPIRGNRRTARLYPRASGMPPKGNDEPAIRSHDLHRLDLGDSACCWRSRCTKRRTDMSRTSSVTTPPGGWGASRSIH